MKNKVRTLGITAALAVMIPLSAYAATTSGSTSGTNTESSALSAEGVAIEARGGFGHDRGVISQEVLDLLKLDKAAFNEKIKAGSTLAQIAEEQGITRENLKKVMTDSFNSKLEERKQEFSDNLDKVIDSELPVGKFNGRFHVAMDFTEVAKVLGLSAGEVKEQLSAGKSLADVAADKGVDVQKLIDAQTTAITNSINQAVKDGNLTQEQADKQLANVADTAEKIVNGKGFGHGHRHGGGKGLGFGGERPSDAATETAEPSAST